MRLFVSGPRPRLGIILSVTPGELRKEHLRYLVKVALTTVGLVALVSVYSNVVGYGDKTTFQPVTAFHTDVPGN